MLMMMLAAINNRRHVLCQLTSALRSKHRWESQSDFRQQAASPTTVIPLKQTQMHMTV